VERGCLAVRCGHLTSKVKNAAEYNFVIYDPEQHLSVSLWDRDLLSQDDLMGEARSVSAVEAVEMSGLPVPLVRPGAEETHQVGTFTSKIDILVTAPGQKSKEGFVCVVRVRELTQDGSRLKGRRLAMRASLKDEEITSKAAAPMADVTETIAAQEMLAKIKDNMGGAGIEQNKIEQVLDLSSLRVSRFAINRSLHFVISADDATAADLILSLIDVDKMEEIKKEASKKKKKILGTSPSSNWTLEETNGEEVLATKIVPLSDILAAPGLSLPGPFTFESEDLGQVQALMFVGLSGLEPTTTKLIQEMASKVDLEDMELGAV